MVKGVYCGDAIVVSVGLKTLDDGRVLFRCTKEGLMTNNARVVEQDMVASNGVIHGIDQVLLPDSGTSLSACLSVCCVFCMSACV